MPDPLLRVHNERRTVRAIAKGRCSIARFGDGEIKLMMGNGIKGQKYEEDLSLRLKEVAVARVENLLIGIPRIFKQIPVHKVDFWRRYATPERARFFDPKIHYHSAFITRPDYYPELDTPDYWGHVQDIWRFRPVLLVKGASEGDLPRDFGLLSSSKWLERAPCMTHNAWSEFDRLVEVTGKWGYHNNDGVIVLCVGPTATILAHDLALAGCQAVDMGHLPSFFRDARYREGN